MFDENDDHRNCVNTWMARGEGLSPEQLLRAFEQALASMWRRAHRTLGDVTLTAIINRVLYNVSERFPLFSSLRLEATGLRCEELRDRVGDLLPRQLEEGIRFALVEFLTVLGNLTGEILTPALHSELLREGSEQAVPGANRPQREGGEPDRHHGEEEGYGTEDRYRTH